jgi:predicted acylesterase/phospholipase RssA
MSDTRTTIEADEREAAEILSSSGTPDAEKMLKLAKRLARSKRFGLARRILKRTRKNLKRDEIPPETFLEIFQKSAVYTYKDPDLPLEWRLDHAFEILREEEKLSTTESQESLGIAGAIYKRKWEVDGLRQNLERALFFYLRGYGMGIRGEHARTGRENVIKYLHENPDCKLWADKDRGYCGINAAFVLDLLAQEEEAEARRAGLVSTAAEGRRAGARLIREEILRSVPPLLENPDLKWLADEWWFYATLGEAYFGLGEHDPSNYDKAVEWLVDRPAAAGLEVPEWEYESTARQLAQLARLQHDPAITEEQFEQTAAGQTLAKFLRNDDKAVRSTFRGKFGLGLSGGGFRASLFHIGVLARLAELDVLRHVEVLSCVSGGSIIGAHYYLELRKLLETKTDDEITREDYIEIVQRVERDFLDGVQRNIRTRVLAEWTTNVKMILSAGYTRTLRVGELYERELFSKVEDGADGKGPVAGPKWVPDWLARPLGWKREERLLNELFINPKLPDGTRQKDFNPRSHNWRRKNKAPILVLNATCLNTGHTWQFTASFMGEPPVPINRDIDCNYRLRRMYYKDAPERYRKVRLGHAVAASSCVPGLFEPLILDGLYPDDDGKLKEENLISVRLVDGGACDNQGVGSLREQDCTVMLVSDASGQMDTVNTVGGGPVGVLLRTSSVSQARVREAQYTDIASRRRSSLLRGLMFIHLRQDLLGDNVAWKDCPSSLKESEFESRQGRADATSFGVSEDVQRKLSAIRTDLDSFSDAEAFALMASAYRMTEQQFDGKTREKCVEGFPSPVKPEKWRFLEVEDAMKPRSNEPARKHLERLLGVGSSLAFKIWKLSPPLIFLKWVLAIAALVGIALLFSRQWGKNIFSFISEIIPWLTFEFIATALGLAVLAAIVNAVVGKKQGTNVMRLIRWRDTIQNIATGVGMSTVGFLAARLHLHVFDRLFLSYGKLKKFPRAQPPSPSLSTSLSTKSELP